jgi:hypothetical protein
MEYIFLPSSDTETEAEYSSENDDKCLSYS